MTAKKPDQRTQRADNDSREDQIRPGGMYKPPSILPVPNPEQGYVFRWVRTASLGNADNTNVSQRLREGWVPVKSDDHKELQIMSDINSQFEGNVEIGGLLLCKAPAADMEHRREYYAKIAQGQMTAVDESFLKENDPRMPMLTPERSSTRSKFGHG
jgi:hypothetical protein